LAAVLFVSLASSVQAETFFLSAEEDDAKYGPFEFREGARIVIEKKTFVLKKLKPIGDTGALEKKLQSLTLPAINLIREPLRTAVVRLMQEIADLDKENPKEGWSGVNIVLNTNGIPDNRIPEVTIHARNITLLDAVKVLTRVTGWEYRLEGNVVFIEPKKEQAQRTPERDK